MQGRLIRVIGLIGIMEALFIAFGAMLLIAGYQDGKTRKVSDRLSAGMWCLGSYLCLLKPSLYLIPMGVFPVLYLYNSIAYPINPKFGFGWADILIIPPYITFLMAIGGDTAVMAGIGAASILTLAYLRMFKKGAPYVLFLAVSYVVALMLRCFAVIPGAW